MEILPVTSDLTSDWRQVDVRRQVTWRRSRNWGKYNSIEICLIHFKFCTSCYSSPIQQQCMSRISLLSFFYPKISIWRNLTKSSGKYNVRRVYKKPTSRSFTVSHNSTWATDRSRTTPQYDLCRRPCQGTLWWLGQRASQVSLLIQIIQVQDFYSPVSHDLANNRQW